MTDDIIKQLLAMSAIVDKVEQSRKRMVFWTYALMIVIVCALLAVCFTLWPVEVFL